MTDQKLIEECKIGLNISTSSTALDGILKQKILAVKSFMKIAGVSEKQMNNDLAVGVIVMGVADLWELEGGEAKFSPAFKTLLSQLTYASEVD